MSIIIFYSWQSDSPKNINRNFIEDVLKKAIDNIGRDIDLQEAIRNDISLDKDTANVPGTPPIVDTIFEKISKCTVFVPDLTFVGRTDDGRLLSNPNVLIEYGWALKALGYSRIVPVMNTNYGKPDGNNLPFDMRHLRNPIIYNLKSDEMVSEKKSIKNDLIKSIEEAIKLVISTLPEIENASLKEIPYTTNPSTFLQPDEMFQVDRSHFTNDIKELSIPNTQHLFLRIIPSKPMIINSSKEAFDIAISGELQPMNIIRARGWSHERNIYGAFCYSCEPDTNKIKYFSQLFKNGEIWGIDAFTLDKEKLMQFYNTDFGSLPSKLIET